MTSRRQLAAAAGGLGCALLGAPVLASASDAGTIAEYPRELAAPAAAKAAQTGGRIVGYPLDPSATPVARAMTRQAGLVRRAVFSALPPSSKPVGVSTKPLAGFPTGTTGSRRFAILSTGNARLAARPNSAPDSGTESRGPSIRGARDVVIMRIDLRVPRGANCLSFDFKFLTEEFPEFISSDYNDAFIAELGISDWSASSKDVPTVRAPRNFATDRKGQYIAINRAGVTSMSSANAKGTTYDGATRRLRASTRVKPGNRKLYLSIFDQGDRIFDSAVFLDNLRTSTAKACRTGVLAAS